MRIRRLVQLLSALAVICAAGVVSFAEPPDAVTPAGDEPDVDIPDFASEVFPILRRNCLECHDRQRDEGGLALDSAEAVDDAADSGVIVAGDAESSELIRRLELPAEDAERMPAVGRPLDADSIRVLRRWIDGGAPRPDDWQPASHWAYEPPRREAPTAANVPYGNPIDAFVSDRLQREGLRPAPQAAPEILLRRLYLDLIGLPPSPAEVAAFVADPSERAYAAAADSLLARPEFGERWARPWLDLARHADSHGFQRDDLRDNWAYRDWVIQAINDDMSFDRFTIEQLAGDLLPDAGESQRIATGFHRNAPTNVEAGSIPEETRVTQIIDRVNTTATVWLGTTLECAQCHDHKYDPFSIDEYYGLLAFFNQSQVEADLTDPKRVSSIAFRGPTMPLSDPERDADRARLEADLRKNRQAQSARRAALDESLASWAEQANEQFGGESETHPLVPLSFESSGNTDTYKVLDDASILLVGDDPPSRDTYIVEYEIESDRPITAFRLDALTDDSLPGTGPGRGEAARPNFVLNTLAAELIDADGATPLRFSAASADFSQPNLDVAGAIDGDPATGWAIRPQFGKPHWAIFVLSESLEPVKSRVVFRLEQNFGGARTLGRFRISAITGNPGDDAVPVRVRRLLQKPPQKWSNDDRSALVDFREQQDAEATALLQAAGDLRNRIQELSPDTTLVMVEESQMRPTHVFERGDYRNPGSLVQPSTPAALHRFDPDGRHRGASDYPDRLSLAKWLADPQNPLAGRVTVNRWWSELFGAGLVATEEDFGIKGDPPTHPELLDFLAADFIEGGGSMKRTLRTIVLSQTYRRDSAVTPQLARRDPDNRLLARGPRFRLDAETIRDNALAISGLLDRTLFGPPIRPAQPAGLWTKVGGARYDYQTSSGGDAYRRGVYVVLKRGSPYPSFVQFDAGNRLACTVRRGRTNTPLQALTLLNDPVYVEMAKAMAARAVEDAESSPAEIISDWFRRCTARTPSQAELDVLVELFAMQRDAAEEKNAEGSRRGRGSNLASDAELSAWYSVATTLLNLHETITKP